MKKPKFIYFIKPVGMDGPIKIGCSEKPAKRLLALSAWSPFVLEIIGQVPGDFRGEQFLHDRFSKQHSHREWFHSSPALRSVIDRVLAGSSLEAACAEVSKTGSIRNQRRRLVTPERQKFIDYGAKIRKAIQPLSNKKGSWYAPPDVRKIMDDWRGDYVHTKPVIPTEDQIARLDQFLADAANQCVYIEYDPTHSQPFDVTLANAKVTPFTNGWAVAA